MMQLVYQSVVYLLAPIACLVLLWRGLRDRSYWQDLPERFGFGSSTTEPAIWVHAVSVGEVQAAVALVQSLRRRLAQPVPHLRSARRALGAGERSDLAALRGALPALGESFP